MILSLAPSWRLDTKRPDVQDDGLRIWVSGESGSGKSWACALIVEQYLEAGGQVVILDAHGEMSSLWALAPNRVQKLGYGQELQEDDVDIALALVRAGQSVFIDLSEWTDVEPQKLDVFMLSFARGLYKLCRENPRHILLLMEEAQNFAPQQQSKGQNDNVKVFTGIITGGRKFGLDVMVASQRISLVDYNIPRSCNIRILMRVSDVDDWKRIKPYLPEGSPLHFNGKRMVDKKLVAMPPRDNFSKFRSGEAIVTSRWFDDRRLQLTVPTITPRKRGRSL